MTSDAHGVTERIHVGVGVMVLALRDPAWAAKQLATLQHVCGGRVVLGVGTVGVMHGTEAWEAVGVPYAERGRRTDEALALLPGLIRGETVELLSGASITLSPGRQPCDADPAQESAWKTRMWALWDFRVARKARLPFAACRAIRSWEIRCLASACHLWSG